MDLWFVLMEFVMLLSTGFFFGAVAQKFRQSPILGYILSGVVIGPFMANPSMVSQVAELGVSLLLFSIGLEFSFQKIKKMGLMAFGGGSLQVIGTILIVTLVLTVFVAMPKALAIGAIVALSSTTIVLRVLVDRAAMDSIPGRSSLSILLLQDIAIVPLVLMISFLGPTAQDISIIMHMLKIFAAIAGLILAFYLLLYHIAPFLLSDSTLFANRELTVLFAISIGLGATWAAHTAQISPALGAFVAGMLLGESSFATQIRADIGSLRTIMVTLFFASVGMLAKPAWFLFHLHWIMPAAVLIFLLKAGIIYCVARLFGLNKRHALATGITLSQIGEFSFVLATTARDSGVLDHGTMDLIISVIIVLMLATPYMVSLSIPLADRVIAFFSGPTRMQGPEHDPNNLKNASRVLVIGLGPAGRHVAQTLKAGKLEPVIVDVNPGSRKYAQLNGMELHLGDAAQEDVLIHAGIQGFCMAVITIPDPFTSMQIIRIIKGLRPGLAVVVRCRYNRHYDDLINAGSTMVIDEETIMGEILSQKIRDYLADRSQKNNVCSKELKGV